MLRELYSGSGRKLLFAFDIGTTHSGISYSIPEPGKVPEIWDVDEFPGRKVMSRNVRVPSVVYYCKDGRVRASGAETEGNGMKTIAEEEGLVTAERFKLHLYPKAAEFLLESRDVPPLPPGKTLVEVLSDFLKYLNECAKQYIGYFHLGAETELWAKREIHYILSHPNGWEEPQRALMKQAAERAGLIKPGGRNRLTFITEGEASLNQYIGKGLIGDSIRRGNGITVVNTREGIVDISAYASRNRGRTFEKIVEPQCHARGSIFVAESVEKYLDKLLRGSAFHGDIPSMKRYFDQTIQHTFRDPKDTHYLQFGPAHDEDIDLNIIRGRLRLDGKVIASFFEPSIKCIVDGILAQCRIAHKSITTVCLVGSLSANNYIFKRVKESLELHGLQVFRPDTQINKLVAGGAIFSVLKHSTSTPAIDAIPPWSRLPNRGPAIRTAINAQPSPPQPSPYPTLSSHFNKLTDDNYHEWKIYMTAHLVREGLLGVVDGTEGHPGGAGGTKKVEDFRDKKARARAELILHVSPSQLIHCSYDDPALIWNALATVHTAHTRATINSIRRQLHQLRLKNGETMSAFIGRARRLAFSIKEAGGDIGDDDFIVSITAGLPSSYGSCLSYFDTLPDPDYNFAAISARLIIEYERKNATSQSPRMRR